MIRQIVFQTRPGQGGSGGEVPSLGGEKPSMPRSPRSGRRRGLLTEDRRASLKQLPVSVALERLGLAFKRDPDFRPRDNPATRLLHVYLPCGRPVELVVTGATWYDRRATHGGRGAIDLAIHLLDLDFKQSVQRLRAAG